MWEDVLNIVDDETSNDVSRLFVQDDAWDGSQYIRYNPYCPAAPYLPHHPTVEVLCSDAGAQPFVLGS